MQRRALLSLIFLAACEGPFVPPPQPAPPPAPAASIELAPDSPSVIVDDTVRLHAVIRDSAGHILTDRPLFWWSPDVTVATVNGAGLVSALSPGRARVILQVEAVVDTATVFVVPYVFVTI